MKLTIWHILIPVGGIALLGALGRGAREGARYDAGMTAEREAKDLLVRLEPLIQAYERTRQRQISCEELEELMNQEAADVQMTARRMAFEKARRDGRCQQMEPQG